MEAFEVAALNAGLLKNTRDTYASILREFVGMMHTAGKKSVASPLDAEAARNIIPLRRTA